MAEANWYVVHTYSGYENKVKLDIEKTIENRQMQDQILDNMELEKERGPIMYGPSPELLGEMNTKPDPDPGWQTESGMGSLGYDPE